MAIQAQDLATQVRTVLQETTPGGMRWKDAELIDWINNAQREVALLKPEASAKNTNIALVEGTLQSIPTDGVLLLNIVRNMGSANNDGSDSAARSVRITEREILDAENPDWHSDSPTAIVLHYMFDENDPTNFMVYPPQPSSGVGYLNIIYSASPTNIIGLTDNITIPDIYANQIVDYVLYRCYQKDADYAGNKERSLSHYQYFRESLGAKSQIDLVNDPNNKTMMMKQA